MAICPCCHRKLPGARKAPVQPTTFQVSPAPAWGGMTLAISKTDEIINRLANPPIWEKAEAYEQTYGPTPAHQAAIANGGTYVPPSACRAKRKRR